MVRDREEMCTPICAGPVIKFIKCKSVDFRQPPRKSRSTWDKSKFSVAIKHQTLIKILNNKGPPPSLPDTTCGQSPLHSKHRPYIAKTFRKIKKRERGSKTTK